MSRVPRIRFKGFEEDWEQRKLGEIVREVTRVDENSNAPVMMITANDGFIEQSERYSTDNAGKSLKKYILLKKWELAYNHGASKIRPFGSCFALTRATNIRIPFVYHCFLSLEDNPEFLEQTLNGKNVENQLRKIVSSGARMDGLLNISFQEYTSIFIRCPIRKEQDKIAILIKSLDHLITLHQRKLEKLKIIKKSMLENLFPQSGEKTPKIRFLGFTKDWEQRKLGEMVEFYNGDRSSRYPNDSDMVFEGIPFINAGDLVLGRVKLDTANKITEEKYNQLSGAKIQCGDIIYCLRGTLGKNAFVDNFDIGTIASSLVDIRPQKIVGKYLFQVLNSDIEYSQRILNDEGAAQPNLSAKNLYLFDIPIPRDVEQIKIAEYLESLDHLITLHQSKLEKLQKIKKSMLESMFV